MLSSGRPVSSLGLLWLASCTQHLAQDSEHPLTFRWKCHLCACACEFLTLSSLTSSSKEFTVFATSGVCLLCYSLWSSRGPSALLSLFSAASGCLAYTKSCQHVEGDKQKPRAQAGTSVFFVLPGKPCWELPQVCCTGLEVGSLAGEF